MIDYGSHICLTLVVSESKKKNFYFADLYDSTSLPLLPPLSFRVLFAVVCTVVCGLLSNVSFGIHDCSNVSCGIDDIFLMDVLWICVYHMPHNREG